MTAMERTEELVQNLLVAQNELILHLSILKAVPNLARALFGSVEKNSTSEKNSTPEKNSSEMEKIRQTWMDDVVGLASEFYINEEAFNLDNLTDLLKATVGAITDILALGPEENSVDQTKKKITFLDKLREDRPEFRNETDEDIWFAECPSEFGYEEFCTFENGPISERCKECWNREFKYSDTDSVNQTKEKTTKPTFRQWQTQKLSIESWTCIDQLAKYHPEFVDEKYVGGAFECPITHGYNAKCLCVENPVESTIEADALCRRCWKQPYKPQV